MKALLFDIAYVRTNLDSMNDTELYELALKGKNDQTRVYSLADFSQACNDEYIDLNNWWLYFVTI